jgi:hypothetical protein
MSEEDSPVPVATKSYSGTRTSAGCVVAVTTIDADGSTHSRLLDPRHDICNHSPSFEWGGGGRGSAQLALAILAEYLEDPALALELHQSFKVRVVAVLPYEGWTLSDEDVAEAILHLG